MKHKIYKKIKRHASISLLLALAFVFLPSMTSTGKNKYIGLDEENAKVTIPETENSFDLSNYFTNTYNNIKNFFSLDKLDNTKGTLVPGSTSGSFLVNQGDANYNVPITVTPGTGGMQPDISISYTSGSGNGYLGEGFSISGLSRITRGGSNKTNNNLITPIVFGYSDKFYLDGQLLMPVSGSSAPFSQEYRTRNESFSKIIAYGSADIWPQYFRVWTKSGLIYDYGDTGYSRIEGQGRSVVAVWAVNKITDTKNNYMTFSYYENNANGEYYISRIDYTGNSSTGLSPYASVRFNYGSRPDPITYYYAGCKKGVLKRLNNIKVYYGGTVMRTYNLAYRNVAPVNSSQLVSIQEIGTGGQCFYPTKFDWGTVANAQYGSGIWNNTVPSGNYGGQWREAIVGDANGDGLSDMIWTYNGTAGTRVLVSLGTRSGHYGSGILSNTNLSGNYGASGWQSAITGDVNGDGLIDIIWTYNGTAGTRTLVSLATGNGHYASGKWSSPLSSGNCTYDQPAVTGDVNGDGLADIIWIRYNSPGILPRVAVSFSNGSANYGTPRIAYPYQNPAVQNAIVGDINGDGQTDIIWTRQDQNGLSVAVSNSYNNVIQNWYLDWKVVATGNYSTSYWNLPIAGDVNGDGLTDLIWTHNGTDGTRAVVALAIGGKDGNYYSSGSGIWNNTIPSGNYSSPNWNHAITGDVNGDGLTDLIWTHNGTDGTRAVVSLAKRNGHFNSGFWNNTVHSGNYSSPYWNNAITGDVNGDGLTDLIWPHNGTDGTRAVVSLSNYGYQRDGYIRTISEADKSPKNGKQISIYYTPLTDASVYTKGGGVPYPNVRVQYSRYVVSSYSLYAAGGVSGGHVKYQYGGLVYNVQGRGGNFAWDKVTDLNSGNITTNWYSQDYHYRGLLYQSETKLSNGKLVSKTVNTFGRKTWGSGINERWFPYLSTEKNYVYKITGNLIYTKTNTWQYNDYGEVTYSKSETSDNHKTETWNYYSDNVNAWYLGRLTHSKVTKHAPGTSNITKHVYFQYDGNSGILKKETINSGNSKFQLVKDYTQDAFGNITQTNITGHRGWAGNETRIKKTTFDGKGRFVTSLTNELGHKEYYVRDNLTGNITKQTGPNGLATNYIYDGFGRLQKETRADGNTTTISYDFSSGGNATSNSVYYIKTKTSGNPDEYTYYDYLNRVVRTQKTGFNGTLVFKDITYDNKGRAYRTSLPYYKGAAIQWTTTTFDALNRPVKIIAPLTGTKTIIYNGLSTTYKNELNQSNSELSNDIGQIIKVTDQLGNNVNYKYDANGNLITVTDMSGNSTVINYDVNGNKTSINDPDAGIQTFYYNAFGEQWKKTDNTGNNVTNNYDKLGRVTKTIRSGETISYTYDSGNKAKGKLYKISSSKGFRETYAYDNYGRSISSSSVLPNGGGTNNISRTYDGYGRLATLTYPSGFKIKNEYNGNNYLWKVKRASDNYTYFTANEKNSLGQMTKFTFGNGKQTVRTYDAVGRVTKINTGNGSVQNLEYTYNKLSSLTLRKDNKRSRKESFTFDVLDRIKTATVKNFSNATQASVTMTYDAMGNITYKSDLGCYHYDKTGNAGPHAVTSIVNHGSYTYDKNGNMLTGPGYTAKYTSFNKPYQIKKGSNKLLFDYDPNNARYRQRVYSNNILKKTIYYVGGLYEKTKIGSKWIKKHFIFASGSVIAIYTQSSVSGTPTETVYLHKDNLGSITDITKTNGSVKESFSYDIWGKRRNPATWTPSGSFDNFPFYNRGFTNHEHLDKVGLIHMNGRVYDPTIGRFLSVDPLVQNVFNSQNLNRYSYGLNNPLAGSDPSGFGWKKHFKHAFKHFKHAFKKAIKVGTKIVKAHIKIIKIVSLQPIAKKALQNKYIAMAVQVGASVYGGPCGAAISSALVARANGASVSDSFKAGAFAYASARGSSIIGHNLGPISKNWALKAVAHGVFQGAITDAQGGKFQAGFLSGLAGSAGGEYAKRLEGWEAIGANMIVGGTASKIGGGKFSNGAMSGAMIMIYNHMNLHSLEFIDKATTMINDAFHGKFAGEYGSIDFPNREVSFKYGDFGFSLQVKDDITGGMSYGSFNMEVSTDLENNQTLTLGYHSAKFSVNSNGEATFTGNPVEVGYGIYSDILSTTKFGAINDLSYSLATKAGAGRLGSWLGTNAYDWTH